MSATPPPPSREVSWWATHEYVARMKRHEADLTVAGTPAWAALDDYDLGKLLSLAAAGEHHVLRVETAQQARADAGAAISAAAPWGELGRRLHQREAWYAAHPWARRIGAA